MRSFAKDSREIHPYVLLFAMVVQLIVALVDPNPLHTLAIALASACLQLAFGWYKTLLAVLVIYLPINLILSAVLYLIVQSTPDALRFFVRIMCLGIVPLPLISMREATFVRALESSKCPRALTIALLIALRFVHVMARHASLIMSARRTLPRAHSCPYMRCVVPLLDRALSISDDLAQSIHMRGFSLQKDARYTSYKQLHVKALDWLYLALGTLCAAVPGLFMLI